MELCNELQCFGCCSCENICTKSAITMVENEYKAILPVIDTNRCIDCGACRRACPAINAVEDNNIKKSYAAWCKDKNIIKTSASSGIVTALSFLTIERGGVVFGTRYENRRLIFDYTEDTEKIKEFQGSKYVQAYVGDSFQKVKQFLLTGREVLFTGTPCQIAGLRRYLNKEYDNLLTIDLICHGVAPAAYLDEYFKNYEFDKVLFRGPEGLKTVAYQKNRIIYSKSKLADLFYMAYVKGLIHRENCYSCPYASIKRVGDITAGDFWGIKKETLKTDASQIPYVSLVLINTDKGADMFSKVQEIVEAEERPIEEAIGYNNQLSKPCKRHPERDAFLDNYKEKGFKGALKGTLLYKQVKKQELFYTFTAVLRKLKRKILK